jgi:antitoxin HigA-1
MPRTPIHPGEHLAEEFNELGISATEAALYLDMPVARITEILNGKGRITDDIAVRLAGWFGTSAQFWMNLQQIYESRLSGRAPSAGR